MTNGRKACLSGDHCGSQTLGDVLYCMVHHSELEAGAVAERIGVRRGYLLDAANPDREDVQFQARLIAPMTAATRNLSLIKYLAAACGGVFFSMPTVELGDGHGDVIKQTTSVVGEFGDMLTGISSALADGRITPDEAEHVTKQGLEAISEIARMLKMVNLKAVAVKERV